MLLFVAGLLVLVPSGTLAEVVEIPVDTKSDPMLGPTESCYIYEEGNPDPVGYEDPTLSIRISRHFFDATSYVMARVKIQSPTQFRSVINGSYKSTSATRAVNLAKAYNAVLAVNGDYYTEKNGNGYMVRQGFVYPSRTCRNQLFDVLIVDYAGNLHILQRPDDKQVQDLVDTLDGGAYQAFTFGPGLVIDGEQIKGFRQDNGFGYMGAEKRAQRMAIAQVGELEYIFVASSGPYDKRVDGSIGLTLDEFSDLVYSLDENITNAYNLDGGSSSTMVFRTAKKKFDKINATPASQTRNLVDIIYFASAWKDGE